MTDTYIDPSRANFEAFKALPRDEPIHMLNLLQYRDQADYPAGHDHAGKGWTGRRAYEEYGKTSGPIFRRVGGTIVWRGIYQTVVTGPDAMQWHDGFIASYPSAADRPFSADEPACSRARTSPCRSPPVCKRRGSASGTSRPRHPSD